MMTREIIRMLAVVLSIICFGMLHADAGTNLLVNGNFNNPEQPLKGWMHNYAWTGNSWYLDNHMRVSVVPKDCTRKSVLRLHGTRKILWGDGQGVKVDSNPVPFEYGAKYNLSLFARTVADTGNPGPNARIYIEGYRWKPGIKPHDNPELHELRRIYKQGSGNILYFGKKKSGPFSNPDVTWTKGECIFPGKDLSKLAINHLKKVKFISVHIVAIDGWDGSILVDDVVLEKMEPHGQARGYPHKWLGDITP